MTQLFGYWGIYWPWNGQIVMAGSADGAVEFRVFDYSKESKISAWSRWTVSGIASLNYKSVVIDGASLWFRDGAKLLYFNYQNEDLIDFNDTPGNAYESKIRFHYNHFQDPGKDKRILAMDITQVGKSTISFEIPQYGVDFQNNQAGPFIQGPTIKGVSYGRTRFPLMITGHAIAPVVSTRSETAWELQSLSLDFITLRR
jgi:hypothetical protein